LLPLPGPWINGPAITFLKRLDIEEEITGDKENKD